MGVGIKFILCLALLSTLFVGSFLDENANAASHSMAPEDPVLAAGAEGHELLRLAYSESQAVSIREDAVAESGQAGRTGETGKGEMDADPWEDEPESMDSIPDPLEPVNRAFFVFNDKLYFWFLKPAGTGYKMVVPEVGRICIRNFFTNLIMPIRAISCLLQGKFEGFGIELVRCVVNTTAGFLGFQDVARQGLGYDIQDEDLGQALAFYGIGPGVYLNLPFLGPSSLRDTAGWVGELYLNPLDYMVDDFWPNVGFRTFDILNKTSLRIGEYEALKKAALDPYVAMRDAYHQYRLNQIEK